VHGAAFSRDVEPSLEGGTVLYDIMASCVKMFKNGNAGCTSVTTKEPCCIGARHVYVQDQTRCLTLLAHGLGSHIFIKADDRGTQGRRNWFLFGPHVVDDAHSCTAGTSFNARFKYVTTNDGVMGIRAAAAPNSTALYQCTYTPAYTNAATYYRRVHLDPWALRHHAHSEHD
jgi:hypothetical protein